MSRSGLILASGSTSRQAILQAASVAFEAITPDVDEDAVKTTMLANGAEPAAIADALAELKALQIAERYPGRLVIGADQVLVYDGKLFNKAKDKASAAEILRTLKGKKHQLISAAVLARNTNIIWRQSETVDLWMRDFSPEFLDSYLAEEGEAILPCVGCYRIEGRGAQLFDKIEGDQFAIRGLPLLPLLRALRQHGALNP